MVEVELELGLEAVGVGREGRGLRVAMGTEKNVSVGMCVPMGTVKTLSKGMLADAG